MEKLPSELVIVLLPAIDIVAACKSVSPSFTFPLTREFCAKQKENESIKSERVRHHRTGTKVKIDHFVIFNSSNTFWFCIALIRAVRHSF